MISYQLNADQIAILTMDNPHQSANVINADFTERLQAILSELKAQSDLKGIIITSAKKTFLAGADLAYFFPFRKDTQRVFDTTQALKALFRQLETIGKPVVAAINGTALGGGFELALACHHRIAIADSKLKIGLPEVSLGLLPGAGGIVKLVRLLGLQNALPFLMEGKKVGVKAALKAGLIDDLALDNQVLIQKAIDWIKQNPTAQQVWDSPKYRIPNGDPNHPKIAQMLAIAPAMLNKKTYGNYPAPQAILNAMVEGARVDFDTACRIESRYFTQLLTGQVAENMINAFWFQLNAINAGHSRPDGFERYSTRKVGILGAGMMGAGIAYVAAKAGVQVILKDISIDKATKGKAYSVKLLDKAVARKRMSEEQKNIILNRIQPTQEATDLSDCDLIIEAVFENRTLKAKVTQEAEAQIADNVVFASNTSTLPITSLATQSKRPDQFIGLHFFSPVDKMQLVEIILGEKTSPKTLAQAFDFVKQIKKIPIVVNDSRGFYTSRVFATYVLEGATLLAEGQHPRLIESAGLQAGMPVAPLALLDEVSLSLVYSIREQTQKDTEAVGQVYHKSKAHFLLEKMVVSLDRAGKKTGKGFYEYPQNPQEKKRLWPALTEHFPTSKALDFDLLKERLMYIQALETVRCLEEGVLTSVADANIGSIFGWGFAPFKGGTLQFINDCGLAAFVAKSRSLALQFGERFEPPVLLEKMIKEGKTFEM